MEQEYVELARQLEDMPGIGIGAVDCHEAWHRALCRRYKVEGYPTLKALVNGKPKAYNGARETDVMSRWILEVLRKKGTGGGSAQCPPGGLFKNSPKSLVVPLCETHFPDADAKNAWLVIVYYLESNYNGDLLGEAKRIATDLGNTVQGAREANPKKQRDRLIGVAKKYKLDLRLPRHGPLTTGPLAKVGALCCDCGGGESARQLCEDILGTHAGATMRPAAAWANMGEQVVFDGEVVAEELVEFALDRLGFLGPGSDDDARRGGGGGQRRARGGEL